MYLGWAPGPLDNPPTRLMKESDIFEEVLLTSMAQNSRTDIMDKIAAYHAESGDLPQDEESLDDRLSKLAEAIHERLTEGSEEPAAEQSVLDRLRW